MRDSVRDHFYTVVDKMNANDGAIQVLFTLALVVFALLGWWVARQQAFNSVLPVPVLDFAKENESIHSSRAIIVRNVGLGPVIKAQLSWQPGKDIGDLEFVGTIHFVAIEVGKNVLFPGGGGLFFSQEVKDKAGSPPWVERRLLGTLTATYQDVHERRGKLVANLIVTIESTLTSSWETLEFEIVSNRLPEDRFRQLIRGRWLPGRN